jgi:signal transduction histidine kinase
VVIRERARALGGEFDIAGDLQRITARMSLPGRTDEQ